MKTYQVYFTDEFGAERKACQVQAKSRRHAMQLAREQGIKGVSDATVVK
jgi:hypothetical protein